MSSAIATPSNPFQVVARSTGPITVKMVEDAVANLPEGLEITAQDIYEDLHGIVTTNAFGDKTPKLADDVAAKVATLKLDEPGGFNNTAAAIAQFLTPVPAPGKIYEQAHELSAAITGAVVALESEYASETAEHKSDKAALIESFKTSVLSFDALLMYTGLWTAMAKPAGHNTFALPHDVVKPMTESIVAQEQTPAFKAILQAQLAPPKPSAADLESAQKALAHELSRPIGGKTDAELVALYKTITAKAKIERIVHRPERFRTDKYQQLMNALNESPMTPVLVPILKEIIARHNVEQRRSQKANYTEISAANAATTDDKQLQAIRKVAVRVAERIGAGDPSVTRIAQGVLNAWVSSVDLDNPHITYYSHLQDIVWDGEKGDWLKFHVDRKGNICEPDAKGAKEVSGESLVEVVFAHELTHISEQAVLNQYLLAVMLGVNLRETSAKAEGCLCSGCQGIVEKDELAAKIMDDPALKAAISSGTFAEEQLKLAKSYGLESAITNIRNSKGAAPSGSASASESALESFFLAFTREGESTADYGAVRAMGPDGPRFMAMAFDIVQRSTGKGSPAERLAALKESYARDHRAVNEAKLEYSEEGGATSHAALATRTTHPTAILRAIANYDYADKPTTQAIWAFESRIPRMRLLGAAHAVDSVIERLEDEHDEFQHGKQDQSAPEEIMKTLERANNRSAIRREYERMRLVTSEIAKLIFADGLNELVPYGEQVHAFMEKGGEPIFRHKGDTSPLAALLGGGEPPPQCVKMAGQLADELEKLVDTANLPEEESAKWADLITRYRAIADESGKAQEQRIARTKGKTLSRQLRK